MIFGKLMERFSEPSTFCAIAPLLMLFGMDILTVEALTTNVPLLLGAVCGFMGIVTPEGKANKK